MKRLASACSWVSAATPSSRPIATSNAPADPSTADGRTARTYAGSGCEPSTESKTILSGTGSSSARGLASMPIANRRARWGQYGRAWRSSRRASALSPAAQHAHSVRPQVRFHGPQPLVLVQPVFAPYGGDHGPERPRSPRAASPPRRETLLNTTAQPRDGLNEVQSRGQDAARQPRHPLEAIGEPRAGAPEARLGHRRQDGGETERDGQA